MILGGDQNLDIHHFDIDTTKLQLRVHVMRNINMTVQNKEMDTNHANYYNNYIPYYTKTSNNRNVHGSRDELMTKLNYMIHLMEEQKDEKTDHVNEELVLYMFLGVFVIFVVDSFARAGKYKRGI